MISGRTRWVSAAAGRVAQWTAVPLAREPVTHYYEH